MKICFVRLKRILGNGRPVTERFKKLFFGGVLINANKTSLFRSPTSLFCYLALVGIAFFFLIRPVVFFAGIDLTLATVILMVIVCLYELKESIAAAFIVYGAAAMLFKADLQIAVIQVASIAFIAWRMRRNNNGLIYHTLLFWLLIGGPSLALSCTIINGYIDQISIFNIQGEVTIALLSSLLVDGLFTYGPLKRILSTGKQMPTGFHFSRIMIHTSLVAITIPYLIYLSLAGYNSTKRIVDIADSRFVSQLQTIESYLNNQADNDFFALKHQGIMQVSLLNQELQRISADTGTEIVITDNKDIVLGSNSYISGGKRFDWHEGGSVAAEFGDIIYWVPDGKFINGLTKWRYAYIIMDNELTDLQLKAVIMIPFSSYLSNLLSSFISQLWVYLFFCLAMFFISSLFNRIFFQPLANLAETTTGIPMRLIEGNRIEWNKSRIIEIDALADNFKTVTDNLESLFYRTHHLAYYDSLTGLPNRLSMQDALNTLFRSRSDDSYFALLFFDLDRFKQVNDTLGHDVGDRLLQEIAARIKTIESESIHVFRVSGDEFVAIADKMDQKEAVQTAQIILNLIYQPVLIGQNELVITSSIGIALYPQHGDNAETLMRLADASMYIAKEEGRNTYTVYSESLQNRLSEHLWIEHHLCKVLELNQFTLYYQAIVDATTSEIRGMEALIRWNHPEKGFITPSQFIPIAEQSGLIIPIGKWVLRQACLQNKKWQDEGFPKVRVAVNISPRQFYSGHMKEEIEIILKETELEPQYLEIEITEGFMVKDYDYVSTVLKELKEMGIAISIDDFGTGYSSFEQLKHFSVDVVKIDKSFVRSVQTDRDNSSIVKAVIELAHGMNLKVVAEGIETESERDFLLRHYCDEMQGFYFAHPMDAERFTQDWQQRMISSKVIERLRS